MRVLPFRLLNLNVALAATMALAGCQSLGTKDNVTVDYYTISGNSTKELDKQIKSKGPRLNGSQHAIAVARIRMLPKMTFGQTAKGCAITKADVKVDAKVTLPRWSGRKNANAELGRAWDNIDRYARLHEATHVAIAFRFAKDIEVGLLDLPAEPKCAVMRERANVYVQRMLEEHDRAQRKFDDDEQKRLSMLRPRKAA